jgi:hypothetical protein
MQNAKYLADAEYFQNYGDLPRDSLGKLPEGEKIYRHGLDYDTNHAGIWSGLANLHLMEDNGEESAKETRLLWPFGHGAREAQALESKSANYWKAREAYNKAESILKAW